MDVEENGAQVGNIDKENFPLAMVVIKGICAFWFGTNNNTIIGRLQ
jgi:hypothetical protein